MRRPRPLPEGALERLSALMKAAKTKNEFQRVQCLWLRGALGLSAEVIAQAVGWHPSSVRRVHARYFKQGESALECGRGWGGRRRQNLTVEQEDALLAGFFASAERGAVLEVGKVKAAYEKAVGHKVPKSTVYRLLQRHDWRKLAPRPRHPKGDPIRQEAFKKNSTSS